MQIRIPANPSIENVFKVPLNEDLTPDEAQAVALLSMAISLKRIADKVDLIKFFEFTTGKDKT